MTKEDVLSFTTARLSIETIQKAGRHIAARLDHNPRLVEVWMRELKVSRAAILFLERAGRGSVHPQIALDATISKGAAALAACPRSVQDRYIGDNLPVRYHVGERRDTKWKSYNDLTISEIAQVFLDDEIRSEEEQDEYLVERKRRALAFPTTPLFERMPDGGVRINKPMELTPALIAQWHQENLESSKKTLEQAVKARQIQPSRANT